MKFQFIVFLQDEEAEQIESIFQSDKGVKGAMAYLSQYNNGDYIEPPMTQELFNNVIQDGDRTYTLDGIPYVMTRDPDGLYYSLYLVIDEDGDEVNI